MTLEARELACTRGERVLFQGLGLSLAGGEALRVAGKNGSGKTSLLRLLAGLSSPASGEVLWQGQSIRRERETFHHQLLYLGHAHGVKDDLLAWENCHISASLSGHPVTREAVCAALEQVGLGAEINLPAGVLSQGQRKRLALARLQLSLHRSGSPSSNPASTLWILDEPFVALDSATVAQLCGTLNAHLAQGGMLIYTTHQEVQLCAQRHSCLELGVELGPELDPELDPELATELGLEAEGSGAC